jgi:hypothetical protein
MGRRKKRPPRSPNRQGNGKTRSSVSATTSQNPWWKRFSAGLVTLLCAPIIVGVAVAIITQELSSNAGHDATPSTPSVSFNLGTNLCVRLHMNIQCVLSDLGANSYMSRKPAVDLRGVPTCGKSVPGFLKWARTNAVGESNRLVLNIASLGHATVEIENLRVSVIERELPLHTTQIECGGGKGTGPSNYIYATALLDGNPPHVSYDCGANPCPVPNVTIQSGGNAQFYILAYGFKRLTEWAAAVDLIVDGRLVTINLGNYVSTPMPSYGSVPDCQPTNVDQWKCTQ